MNYLTGINMDTKYSRRTFLTSAGVLAAGSLFTAPLRAALGSAEKNIIVALDPSNGYSGWQPGQAIPEKIAPIKAPFAMPQLSRPTFKNVDFNIVDYGAVIRSIDESFIVNQHHNGKNHQNSHTDQDE